MVMNPMRQIEINSVNHCCCMMEMQQSHLHAEIYYHQDLLSTQRTSANTLYMCGEDMLIVILMSYILCLKRILLTEAKVNS